MIDVMSLDGTTSPIDGRNGSTQSIQDAHYARPYRGIESAPAGDGNGFRGALCDLQTLQRDFMVLTESAIS
jgi:hypothetical protein